MGEVKQLFTEGDDRWLHDDTPLWRYVPLRTLFFYLSGLIFIPSLAKLRKSDPFEGEFFPDIAWFNKAFHDFHGSEAVHIENWMEKNLCSKEDVRHLQLNRTYLNAAAEIYRKRYFGFIRKTRFAWCWFRSGRESAAMWNSYGNQGVAVQTTIGRLRRLFSDVKRDFLFGPMVYVDSRTGRGKYFNPENPQDAPLLIRPYFLKRSEYESETEVRFVTSGSPQNEREGILFRDLKPDVWISCVRLWPGLTDDEAGSIGNVVQHFAPNCECTRSDLFDGPESHSGLLRSFMAEWEGGIGNDWLSNRDGIHAELKRL
jgi:hypothetical protein